MNKILSRPFLTTMFITQNNHHRFSVLGHTISVAYHCLINKQFKMIPAAILHDIGKPLVAFQDDEDKETGQFSFPFHEEISYAVIKKMPFISDYTKRLVRHHFLLRGMDIDERKGRANRFRMRKRRFEKLDKAFIEDLKIFQIMDDKAK